MSIPINHSSKYRADIDGLRAIAVLLVLVFHFRLVAGGDVGFIGVDIFFVISGYLITGILFKDLELGRFTFSEFYVRRIRRLAPALFVTLVLTAGLGAWILFPSDFLELSRQVLSAQFYVSNFYYWKNVSYFGLSAQAAPLLHTWSLAVEEQFYLLYPILVFVLHRYFRKYFWWALAGAGLLSLLLSLGLSAAKPGFSFYLLPTRAWELILGGLVVPLQARLSGAGKTRIGAVVMALSVVLLVVALCSHRPDMALPGYFSLLPTVAAAGLILAGDWGGRGVKVGLSFAPLVAIGRISYPLYLVHWPLHVFPAILLGQAYSWIWRFVFFVLSVALATLVWRFVEEPVRKKRVLQSNRSLLQVYGVGLLLTVSFFAMTEISNGFPQRFPPEAVRMAQFADDKVPALTECQFEIGSRFDAGFGCVLGVKNQKPTWLIVGDSHAWAVHEALDHWLKLNGRAATFAFRHSCPPLQGISLVADKGVCEAFNNEIRSYLSRTDSIKHVLLISTWRQFIEGRIIDSETGNVLDVSNDSAAFRKIFHQNFSWLREHGKTTHLWEPVPGARASVPETLARDYVRGEPSEIRHSLADYQSDYQFLFGAIKNESELINCRYSPSQFLCVSGLCDVVIDGVPLYFDNAHVSKSSWPKWLQILNSPICLSSK